MKKTSWLIFCALLSADVMAQQPSNPPAPATIESPPAAPALTNTTPTKKAARKKTGKVTARKKEKESELASVPLIPGPATVVASNVNVRGQAGLKGEVITHVTKGQSVVVLEEITLKKSGPEEPSAWAKIAFPTNGHVWVNASFIDASNRTVLPKKLNLRGGPGENFSVLGTMKRGDAVQEIGSKGDWLEIAPPPDAFAFVAAQYLKQEAPAAPPVASTEPPPVAATVAETQPIATPPTETPVPVPTPSEPTTTTPATTTATTVPVPEEPPPKRIVQHEGIVRGTFSIQAPTEFELISPENKRVINYLYSTARDLDLSRYKGMLIVVTREEGLDERWRNTPVLTIQRIQVIE